MGRVSRQSKFCCLLDNRHLLVYCHCHAEWWFRIIYFRIWLDYCVLSYNISCFSLNISMCDFDYKVCSFDYNIPREAFEDLVFLPSFLLYFPWCSCNYSTSAHIYTHSRSHWDPHTPLPRVWDPCITVSARVKCLCTQFCGRRKKAVFSSSLDWKTGVWSSLCLLFGLIFMFWRNTELLLLRLRIPWINVEIIPELFLVTRITAQDHWCCSWFVKLWRLMFSFFLRC